MGKIQINLSSNNPTVTTYPERGYSIRKDKSDTTLLEGDNDEL